MTTMTFGCRADADAGKAMEDTITANALTERTMRARTECNIDQIPLLPNPTKSPDLLFLAGPGYRCAVSDGKHAPQC